MADVKEVKKQSIGALFGTDPKKEEDGIVVAYGANLRVRLGRAGGANARFIKAAEERTRAYRRMIASEMLPPEMDRQLTREVFAEGVVFEWTGAYDDDGEEIPYSFENVVAEMEKYPEFLEFIMAESRKLANYRKATLELEAKN